MDRFESLFRRLREAWFDANLREYPGYEPVDEELMVMRNDALKRKYDAQTEFLVYDPLSNYNLTPRRPCEV